MSEGVAAGPALAEPQTEARGLRFRSLPPTQSGKLVLGRGGGPGVRGLVPPWSGRLAGTGGEGCGRTPVRSNGDRRKSPLVLASLLEIGKLLANR
jgi:hypothetical protein